MWRQVIQSRSDLKEKDVEQFCSNKGLTLTMKGMLKTIGPNMHWHYKKGKEKGLLEITLMKDTGELAFNCKENRKAEWILEFAEEMKKCKHQ